jgi:hypothetical protein
LPSASPVQAKEAGSVGGGKSVVVAAAVVLGLVGALVFVLAAGAHSVAQRARLVTFVGL